MSNKSEDRLLESPNVANEGGAGSKVNDLVTKLKVEAGVLSELQQSNAKLATTISDSLTCQADERSFNKMGTISTSDETIDASILPCSTPQEVTPEGMKYELVPSFAVVKDENEQSFLSEVEGKNQQALLINKYTCEITKDAPLNGPYEYLSEVLDRELLQEDLHEARLQKFNHDQNQEAVERSLAFPPKEGLSHLEIDKYKPDDALSKLKVAAEEGTASFNCRPSIDNKRDVVLGEGSEGRIMTTFLHDIVRLQHVLWTLSGELAPQSESDLKLLSLVERLYHLLILGKRYELAGLKDVPRPFLRSCGKVYTKSGVGFVELSENEVKETLARIIFEKLSKIEDKTIITASPYKEFKEIIDQRFLQGEENATTSLTPAAKDVLLFQCCNAFDDKLYEQQTGNKLVFNMASQLVTSYAVDSEKRVEAALMIIKGVHDANFLPVDDKQSAGIHARFLLQSGSSASGDLGATTEDAILWRPLSVAEAAEFAITFVFEVYLEKELLLIPSFQVPGQADTNRSSSPLMPTPSKDPVPEPSENDVLFGRGGMTNSHPGNRRFRDIIALHRPDYIRAVKMDKPAVARKIVKALRWGHPKGRFLKKGDDGNWYDVGDRTAAEKTSQGLRERTNAEKRHRSALREALHIRKQDLEESDDNVDANAASTGSNSETPAGKKLKRSDLLCANSILGVNSSAFVMPTALSYVGTSLPVPLSLNIAQIVAANSSKKKDSSSSKPRPSSIELNTEGLPPNAVDDEGNILVTDYDILCGRGGLTNHHKGNKRFRDIVALHRPDYVRAPKIQKPSVARVIVRAIRNGEPPGRFLRKDEKTGKWVDIGDKKAAEKTSQALREKPTDERDNLKSETNNSVGVMLPHPTSYLVTASADTVGSVMAETSALATTEAVAAAAAAAVAATADVIPLEEAEVQKQSDDRIATQIDDHIATHNRDHIATHNGDHIATHNGDHIATQNDDHIATQNEEVMVHTTHNIIEGAIDVVDALARNELEAVDEHERMQTCDV